MAVLDAMGLLPEGEPFVHEGLSGALLRGRVVGRSRVGDTRGPRHRNRGLGLDHRRAHILLDEDDPCRRVSLSGLGPQQ